MSSSNIKEVMTNYGGWASIRARASIRDYTVLLLLLCCIQFLFGDFNFAGWGSHMMFISSLDIFHVTC